MGKLELKLYGEKPGRKCIKLLTVVLDRMMFPVLQCWFFPERPVIILKGKKKIMLVFVLFLSIVRDGLPCLDLIYWGYYGVT